MNVPTPASTGSITQIALGDGPRQEHDAQQRQDADPRVPRADQHRRAERHAEHEDDEPREHRKARAAATVGDEDCADRCARVDQHHAEQCADVAEHPRERREHVEQQRTGVVPAPARPGARQWRVASRHLGDLEHLQRDVAGRCPRCADQADRQRDERDDDQHARGDELRPATRCGAEAGRTAGQPWSDQPRCDQRRPTAASGRQRMRRSVGPTAGARPGRQVVIGAGSMLQRIPMPESVRKCSGRAGSRSSLRRMRARCRRTRRGWMSAPGPHTSSSSFS